MGYFDPLYYETGFLSKESDVYSFGVVLFEVLCGRLCVENYDDIRRFLAKLAQKCYEEKKLDTIINSTIKEQISPLCLQIFSKVAYQCLRGDRKQRPSMEDIVKELEIALQCQDEYEFVKKKKMVSHVVLDSESDEYWETKLPSNVEALIKKFNIPHATTKRELFSFLHKGYLFDDNNQFFWIDDHGNKCLAISAKRILDYNQIRYTLWVADNDSRFTTGAAEYHIDKGCYKCKIKASMLSLGTIYAASLILKFHVDPNPSKVKLMRIKWKTKELSVHSVHCAHQSPDGKCYTIQMWHFISDGLNADFNIIIEELSFYEDRDRSRLLIQGIEFQPIEMMQEDEEVEGLKSLSITDEEDIDDDEYWDKKLPDEYPRYIAMSDKLYNYTTKKELYLSLCQGFIGCNGKLWFSMCKSTRGICSILPATHVLSNGPSYKKLETLSLSESRFKEVLRLGTDNWYSFTCKLGSFMFSPHYSYACYLVFKFEDNHVLSDDIYVLKAEYKLGDTTQGTVVVLLNPTQSNIPTIEPKKDIGLCDSSKSIRMPKGYMDPGCRWVRERNDCWTEFSLIEPLPQLENHQSLEVKLLSPKFGGLEGVIVEGIEFRPVVRDRSYLAKTSTKDNLIGTHQQGINDMQEDEEVEGLKSLSITDEEDIDDDEYWDKKLPDDYPRYIAMSDKLYNYTTKKELYLGLCQGFIGCNGKLWFSMCKSNRGICSILPATHVLSNGPSYEKLETLSLSESRFKEVLRLGTDNWYNFTCGLGSFMLSPHYSYACYLVFKFEDNHVLSDNIFVLEVEYNLGDTTQGTVFVHLNRRPNNIVKKEPKRDIGLHDSSKSIRMPKGYMDPRCSWVRERNDGWTEFSLIEPLPQLENHQSLEVKLLRPKFGSLDGVIVEGIEFRPLVCDGSYLAKTSTKDNLIGTHLQAINDHEENKDDDEYWENKLPDDYQHHIKMSVEPLNYTTKKELYLLFCDGFLADNDNGQLWFSTCKLTRGLCSMLPATHVLSKDTNYKALETLSLSESRFKEVIKLRFYYSFVFTCRLESFMFSPDHDAYACYLVFKFDDDQVLSNDVPIFKADLNDCRIEVFANLDLTSVITIRTQMREEKIVSSNSIEGGLGIFQVYTNIIERKSWVEKRNDGWMEARLTNPLLKQHLENSKELKIELRNGGTLNGIIVEGVEFRPVAVDGSYLVVETSIKDNIIGTHLQAINDHEQNKDDDEYWEKKLPDDYQRHIKMSVVPLDYSTKKELYLLFCHGFLAHNNNGQLWFSTCKLTRGLCSILPATHVLFKDSRYHKLETLHLSESRFKEVKKLETDFVYYLRCRLESFMFSPDHYTYACYLVFKFKDDHVLPNDGPVFTAYLNNCFIEVFANLDLTSVMTKRVRKSWVEKRNDGWMEARLTKPLLKHHLENREILRLELHKIEGGSLDGIIVEGVEFRPEVVDGSYLQAINHHEENKDDDEYWEKKLPDDYQRHIEMSDEPLDYTTKKELYLLFCHGFLANSDIGQLWFSACKLTRGLCSILPSTHVLSKDISYNRLKTQYLSESRFKEVKKLGTDPYYYLTCRLESFMFSPDHYTYACYLVFKFEDDHVLFNDGPMFTANLDHCYIPVFANLDSTSVITKREGQSQVEKRNDGWMEARLTKPLLKHHLENREKLRVELHKIEGGSLDGIIVEGVEIREVVVDGSYLLVETSYKDNFIGTHLQAINDHEENIDDDEYWEKKLPDDYQRHIEMSDEPLDYSTKRELYLLFCHGFLANNDIGQLWFSTCKFTRGLCSILPATHVLSKDYNYKEIETQYLSESRFKEVGKLVKYKYFDLTCRLESFMFSPDHDTYACYLVFKFDDDHVLSNDGYIFTAELDKYRIEVFADLDLTSVTTIRTLLKTWVEKRNDGWMEARLTKPLLKHDLENREELNVELYNIEGGSLDGIIVEGIEFRPVVVDGEYVVET